MSGHKPIHRQLDDGFLLSRSSSPTKSPLAPPAAAGRRALLVIAIGIILFISSSLWSTQDNIISSHLFIYGTGSIGQTGCYNLPLLLDKDIDSQCHKLRAMNESYSMQEFEFGGGLQSNTQLVQNKETGEEYVSIFVKDDRNKRAKYLSRIINRSHTICGRKNVIQMADVVCYNDTTVVPIFKKCSGTNLIEYFYPESDYLDAKTNCTKLSPDNIRRAIKGMFIGMQQLMDAGICHRDFALANAMFDEDTGNFCVIDMGAAKQTTRYGQCIGIDMDFPVDAAYDEEMRLKIEQASWRNSIENSERLNRSHIILFRFDDTLSVLGVMAALLSLPKPFVLQGESGESGYFLVEDITWMLGREKLAQHVEKYNLTIPERMQRINMKEKAVDWRTLKNECNKELLTEDAVSFLEGFVTFSYVDRLNFFRKAHEHPFLKDI